MSYVFNLVLFSVYHCHWTHNVDQLSFVAFVACKNAFTASDLFWNPHVIYGNGPAHKWWCHTWVFMIGVKWHAFVVTISLVPLIFESDFYVGFWITDENILQKTKKTLWFFHVSFIMIILKILHSFKNFLTLKLKYIQQK